MNTVPSAHGRPPSSTPSAWIEQPDIVVLRPIGPLLPEHFSALTEAKREVTERLGYTFTHVDFSATTSFPLESRRVAREYARLVPSRAVAVTGASYHLTVVASALARGVDALLRLDRPIRFFLSKEEAYAWLSTLRDRAAAEHRPSHPMTG